MEKRVVLTMIAMMAFLMAFSYIYPLFYPPSPVNKAKLGETAAQVSGEQANGLNTAVTENTMTAPVLSQTTAHSEVFDFPAVPEKVTELRDIVVTTSNYTAIFSEKGGRLKSFVLSHYDSFRADPDMPRRGQELVIQTGTDADIPLGLELVLDRENVDLSQGYFQASHSSLNVPKGTSQSLAFTARTARGLVISKVFTFSDETFLIGQKVILQNQGTVSYGGYLAMNLSSAPYSAHNSRYNTVAGILNGSLLTESPSDIEKKLSQNNGYDSVDWLGYMDQYFLSSFVFASESMVPDHQNPGKLKLAGSERKGGGAVLTAAWPLDLSPGREASYNFDVFYGPKDDKVLVEAGHELGRSVDLGWFTFLAKPMAWLLRRVYTIVGNYGLAIIVVTILVKLVLWPLTAKSYRSMKEMQKIQPKIMKLREKYKDDREAMNREMMQLYKAFHVNPFGGCLPMLFQIPFFIAFYRVLDYALELRGEPFFLWITDLSAPDRLGHFAFSLPLLDPPTGIPVLTILMGLSMFWQQKMSPAMGDPVQAKVMMLMPVVFTFVLLNMPSGLVLYWLVNNILSILQQKFINRPDKKTAEAAAK